MDFKVVLKALLNFGGRGLEAAQYVSNPSSHDPNIHYVDCIDSKTIREKAAQNRGSPRPDIRKRSSLRRRTVSISIEPTKSTLAQRSG